MATVFRDLTGIWGAWLDFLDDLLPGLVDQLSVGVAAVDLGVAPVAELGGSGAGSSLVPWHDMVSAHRGEDLANLAVPPSAFSRLAFVKWLAAHISGRGSGGLAGAYHAPRYSSKSWYRFQPCWPVAMKHFPVVPEYMTAITIGAP